MWTRGCFQIREILATVDELRRCCSLFEIPVISGEPSARTRAMVPRRRRNVKFSICSTSCNAKFPAWLQVKTAEIFPAWYPNAIYVDRRPRLQASLPLQKYFIARKFSWKAVTTIFYRQLNIFLGNVPTLKMNLKKLWYPWSNEFSNRGFSGCSRNATINEAPDCVSWNLEEQKIQPREKTNEKCKLDFFAISKIQSCE